MLKHQALFSSIKHTTLRSHLQRIALLPQPEEQSTHKHQGGPFEVYIYDEISQKEDGEYVYGQICEEIINKYNDYLFEEESNALQLQIYGLDQAIQMQKSEIALLKLQVEGTRINKKIQASLSYLEGKQNKVWQVNAVQEKEVINLNKSVKQQKYENNDNKLSIYPCVRVQIQPSPDSNPNDIAENTLHIKSHRRLNAIYTKRSVASSHDHLHLNLTKLQKDNQQDIQNATIPIQKQRSMPQMDLRAIQRQIAFVDRAWKNAKKQKNNGLCRQYKQQLMVLLQQFWAVAKQ